MKRIHTLYAILTLVLLGFTSVAFGAKVKQPASYPGGIDSLQVYLNEHFDFSQFQNSTYLEVLYCNAEINKDGSLRSFSIPSKNAEEIESELERIITGISIWNPARKGKRAKRSKFPFVVSVIVTDTLKQVYVGLEKEEITDKIGDELWVFIEREPEFVGGVDSMYTYLVKEIIYPEEARMLGKKGKVYVKFIIEKDGLVSNARVVRGRHELLNAEALRVVNNMPKWIPGIQNGKPVRFLFTLPIHFRLSD